eukprot:NODE_664_length_1998_cov_46.415085_g614_i0.p1 GENE.NODE_664_length_1998_cov_46.415085_g614_i0~~NODE_664_length_1998_cov_46.415085_g614_i0.p1  ORF type:complete len:317 (-),score=43.65 NODE_664_length_1998_cov_46.415085_g614_i0:379-1329(-)
MRAKQRKAAREAEAKRERRDRAGRLTYPSESVLRMLEFEWGKSEFERYRESLNQQKRAYALEQNREVAAAEGLSHLERLAFKSQFRTPIVTCRATIDGFQRADASYNEICRLSEIEGTAVQRILLKGGPPDVPEVLSQVSDGLCQGRWLVIESAALPEEASLYRRIAALLTTASPMAAEPITRFRLWVIVSAPLDIQGPDPPLPHLFLINCICAVPRSCKHDGVDETATPSRPGYKIIRRQHTDPSLVTTDYQLKRLRRRYEGRDSDSESDTDSEAEDEVQVDPKTLRQAGVWFHHTLPAIVPRNQNAENHHEASA